MTMTITPGMPLLCSEPLPADDHLVIGLDGRQLFETIQPDLDRLMSETVREVMSQVGPR